MLEDNENPSAATTGQEQEQGTSEPRNDSGAQDAGGGTPTPPAGDGVGADAQRPSESRKRRPRRAASRAAGPPATLANPFLAKQGEAAAPPAEESSPTKGEDAAPRPSVQAPPAAAVALFKVPELPAGEAATEAETDEGSSDRGEEQPRRRGRNRRRGGGAADDAAGDQPRTADEGAGQDNASQDGRGQKGAGRGGAQQDSRDAEPGERGSKNGSGGESDRDPNAGTKKRRRRKRGASAEVEADADDPNTVTKVRAPKEQDAPEKVTGVKGSTRLEAKKQRRREGREAGRRRAPILSEAEFLARRESVDRGMVVRQLEDVTQIAVLEDGVLVEHYVTKEAGSPTTMVGNVYLGRVQNVLPSMEAAFVDVGRGRNAVLYAGEVNWDAAGLDGQPKRIEFALKSGDPVLVQVTKDPVGHKGARLTSQVSLPGLYLVFVPYGSMSGISRKLPDKERSRLRTILKRIVPEDAGVIVRTAAEGISEEELERDVARLQKSWEEIQRKAGTASPPQLLYAEPDLAIRVVRDIFNEDFGSLQVAGDKAWRQVKQYVDGVAPDLADRVSKWSGSDDIFAHYRIDEQLAKALDRKVWLPSGGSLIIEHTEAMTVIDVNTGKFTGKGGNLEETVTQNNLEAAEEIVRQVRLRDIGGIIVIDFIDMVLENNRDLVLRRLVECLGRDRTKHQVTEITSLGLAQMTRKRIGGGLLETFSETCDACSGRGVKIHFHGAGAPVAGKRKAVKPSGAHDPVEMMMRTQDDESDGEAAASEETASEAQQPGQDDPATAGEASAAPATADAAPAAPAPADGAQTGPETADGERATGDGDSEEDVASEPPVHEVVAADADELGQRPDSAPGESSGGDTEGAGAQASDPLAPATGAAAQQVVDGAASDAGERSAAADGEAGAATGTAGHDGAAAAEESAVTADADSPRVV